MQNLWDFICPKNSGDCAAVLSGLCELLYIAFEKERKKNCFSYLSCPQTEAKLSDPHNRIIDSICDGVTAISEPSMMREIAQSSLDDPLFHSSSLSSSLYR